MAVRELSRTEARRIAVRAQRLDQPRPTGLLDVVRRLSLLQVDLTNAVAPSADLVLWSRLGSAYRTRDLVDALDRHELIELRGMIRPAEDLALYRAEMAGWAVRGGLRDWEEHQRSWVEANDRTRREILARLTAAGPLPPSELPRSVQVQWRSSGWNQHRSAAVLLDLMASRGEVAVAGRDGREPLWDLAERVYPDDPVVPEDKALRSRAEKRLRSLGIARARAAEPQDEPRDLGEAGEPAVVEGVRGTWRVDPAQLDQPFRGRTALLSPLDRLVYDRKRMLDLFGFDYALEMYKPATRRRWGYYALPILHGDQLVGKVDATADRKAGGLRVDAIHEDVPFTPAMTAAVNREITDLARWLGLGLIRSG